MIRTLALFGYKTTPEGGSGEVKTGLMCQKKCYVCNMLAPEEEQDQNEMKENPWRENPWRKSCLHFHPHECSHNQGKCAQYWVCPGC